MKNQSILNGYCELTKPRILSLVLITTTLGYFLGGEGIQSYTILYNLLLGVTFVCGGSGALNHYLERDVDQKMQRTKNRPIPSGLIKPSDALLFGVILILVGVFFLWWKINLLTSFLSLLTAFLYVLVYTPLKKVSWLNTSIGAIPGALPPMGGWAAATGELNQEAWILFFILFVWQHPHFYSIAWMFKEDYKRGGLKMLPVIHPDGKSTFQQIIFFSIVLIPLSILPTWVGMSGRLYLYGAIILGILMFIPGFKLSQSKSTADAKKLLKASVVYLPLLLLLIACDVTF